MIALGPAAAVVAPPRHLERPRLKVMGPTLLPASGDLYCRQCGTSWRASESRCWLCREPGVGAGARSKEEIKTWEWGCGSSSTFILTDAEEAPA